MPSKNAIKTYVADGYYHVYNRGVNKRTIFKNEQDYAVFLSYLKTYLLPKDLEKLNAVLSNPESSAKEKDNALSLLHLNNFHDRIGLLAYCLMPNHYHFLLHQAMEKDIESFMKSCMTRYTMYFNKKHGRVGPLFQGQYKAVLVDTDEQLLYLSRYIHRNPLSLSDHERSLLFRQPTSYGVYLGTTKQEWVKPDAILAFFSSRSQGFNSYQSFVEGDDSPTEEKSLYLTEKLLLDA